jgi:hypothetical protein
MLSPCMYMYVRLCMHLMDNPYTAVITALNNSGLDILFYIQYAFPLEHMSEHVCSAGTLLAST